MCLWIYDSTESLFQVRQRYRVVVDPNGQDIIGRSERQNPLVLITLKFNLFSDTVFTGIEWNGSTFEQNIA